MVTPGGALWRRCYHGPPAGSVAPRPRTAPPARSRRCFRRRPLTTRMGSGKIRPTSTREESWLLPHRRARSKGTLMRKVTGFILAALALCLLASGAVLGSGYSIYEQGARAMANAGAFTARADDPSALFFNPAGIVQLDGIRLNFGTNAIFLTGSEFESSSGPTTGQEFDQAGNAAWPSSLYYTHKLNDRWA